MKFNWGTGIFITIVIFLIGMITLVVISSMQPLNLVTPDYYPKGIDYQQQINKIERTKQLAVGIQFTQDEKLIYLDFPAIDSINKPAGKVLVFFPRDNNLDREYNIEVNDSLIQTIPKERMVKGRCIIKIDWSFDGVDYYQEEDMMLN